jgi:hypothetical protein
LTNIPTALALNPSSGLFTKEYAEPWRFRILIKDKYNQSTLYTIDQFSQNNPFAVTDLNLNVGVQNTGDFAISINDTKDRAFDRNIVDCGNFIVLQMGQTPSSFQNILYGRLDAIGTTRTRHETDGVIGAGKIMDLGGHGTGSIFNQRFINVNIAVPKEAVNIIKIIENDPKYYISNIFSGIVEGDDVMPITGLPTLKTHGNFSLDQIADNIKQVIPGASQTMVLASQFLSFLADSAGAIWGVDENNSVYLRYPAGKGRHSGITVKSLDDPEDLAYCTSYAIADFGFIDSILPENGFANAIYGVASNIDNIASGVFEAESFSSLFKKDLCQQIVPGAAKFRDLVLYLSKTGAGTHAPNPIADLLVGKIVKDDGSDNPTGAILGNFYIPIKDIIESPQAMYISTLNLLTEDIDPRAKYWFVLKSIGNSEENTIRVWHNNDFTEQQKLASGFRKIYEDPREINFNSNSGWIKSFHGPNYTHAISTKLRKITYVSDPLSMLRWTPTGAVEAMVNVGWINDAQTMAIYLNQLLYFSSKLQRQYTYNVVTIPTTMFRTGSLITMEDHLLEEFEEGRNVIAEVQELGISYSGSALTNQGVSELVIRPKGFVSPDQYKLIDTDESLEVEFLE